MTFNKYFENRAKRLRPMALPASLEGDANSLFEEVNCGTRSIWPLLKHGSLKDSDLREKFYRLAHNGMWAAQERFISRIGSSTPMVPGEESLYRTAMDTIAWQMIEKQLCYARRLFREKRQPSLSNSNLASVVMAARHIRESKPNSMPLISDLTTFVQIGDLLTYDPNSGMSIGEVKEGDKNREIGRLASFYRHSECGKFKQIVSETESPKVYEQFERMLRQIDRMEFASNVLGKGSGRDPDSKQQVVIPEPYIPMQPWDDQLNSLFDKAREKRWAIDIVDECLFVGCYSDKQMMRASPVAFLPWLDEFSEGERCPAARLIDCVLDPLALPLFAIPTHPERMMDLLFGRLHVCMGISLPLLVEECRKQGIVTRPPNKQERRTIANSGAATIKYKGHPMVLEREDKRMILGDGVFLRSMFHFQRPLSVINALLDNSDLPEVGGQTSE